MYGYGCYACIHGCQHASVVDCVYTCIAQAYFQRSCLHLYFEMWVFSTLQPKHSWQLLGILYTHLYSCVRASAPLWSLRVGLGWFRRRTRPYCTRQHGRSVLPCMRQQTPHQPPESPSRKFPRTAPSEATSVVLLSAEGSRLRLQHLHRGGVGRHPQSPNLLTPVFG